MATIEDIFKRNRVAFQQTDISCIPFLMSLPVKVKEYLQYMGKTIECRKEKFARGCMTLYSIKVLMDNQDSVCNANSLLVIGNGLNGDLLTINLKNNHIGYVFHDDLWEQNYSDIKDIYCELPFEIDVFLKMVLEDRTYPIDGTAAEKMKSLLSME